MDEKEWKNMTDAEKRKAYNVAIESGDMGDTFTGFSKMMHRSRFDANTGKPIEIYW